MNKTKLFTHFRTGMKVALLAIVLATVSGCTDDIVTEELQPNATAYADAGARKGAGLKQIGSNPNSFSYPSDYSIQLTVVGSTWTYVICKNAGAKDLSHFILNFQNCGSSSATINNIVCATVNGQPAVLENSEGNTGCNVNDVTTNFVKFDDLPSANSYTIVFKLNKTFGNFVGTTAWLKAGNSCIAYSVLAPCCPI